MTTDGVLTPRRREAPVAVRVTGAPGIRTPVIIDRIPVHELNRGIVGRDWYADWVKCIRQFERTRTSG